MDTSYGMETRLTSGEQHKLYWATIGSKRPESLVEKNTQANKKRKPSPSEDEDEFEKGLKSVGNLEEVSGKWHLEEVLDKYNWYGDMNPVRMVLENLDHKVWLATEAAKAKIKALREPAKILAAKPAVAEEDGSIIEMPKYLVKWKNDDLGSTWVLMTDLEDDHPVVQSFWKLLGIDVSK